MKSKITLGIFILGILMSTNAFAQAFTSLADGDYQITTLDTEPLYMTGGTATIAGISPTFTTLIAPASTTQIWTITKGTSGNATDKYFIKSKNEGVPLTTQTLLKLTAAGGIPVNDGRFHANTLYKIGDTYAIKVAAGLADATTTYSAKFWTNNASTLGLSAAAAASPLAGDYIINFISYNGGTTNVEMLKAQKKICAVTRNGIVIQSESGNLTIFSMNGKIIKSVKVENNTILKLAKGMYVVQLNTPQDCYTERVVVL